MSLPRNFLKRLNENKVIPFIGAGVSMNVKDESGNNLFPNWKDLLLASAERLKNDGKDPEAKLVEGYLEKNPPNYLKAAEEAREGLNSEWYDFLKESFNKEFSLVDENSLKIPRAIWTLGSNLIITTNYDKVLSWSCSDKDRDEWNIEATYEQVELIRNQAVKNPTIWHLHGKIGDVRNMILTPDGYQNLYPIDSNSETIYEAALKTLQSLLTSHTFLFIGFSLDDEYFINQIRYIRDIFKGTNGKHYVLIREAEKAKLGSLKIGIEPIVFESFGAPMLEKLEEIRNAYKAKKSETKTPHDEPEEQKQADKTATERFDPQNYVFYVPFLQKGDQVVGREKDLEQVHETLANGKMTNIGPAVSFQGLGGLGKTQLAVEYSYRYREDYKNGVIWLVVDQDIEKQLVEICDKAGWVAPISEIKVKLDVARNRLKTITNCLIVLDNVEKFDDEIKQYLPAPDSSVHILATSRNELIGFEPLPLPLLTSNQAVEMLKKESRRKLNEDERVIAAKIAEELGRLPLALELAGAFLHYRDKFSWGDYLVLLKENPRSAFEGRFLSGNFTKHDTDVYRTLKVSETLFEAEPLLRDILDLLTWSGTAPMGVSLMAHLIQKKEIELKKALSFGETLRLLTKSSENDAYAIHRLVAQVRQEDIPLKERTVWANKICRHLGNWFQEIRNEFEKLPEFEADLEHLVSWQQNAEKFSQENATQLLWLQGYPPYYRGRFQEAKEIVRQAIDLYQKTNCEDKILLAHLYNDFGGILTSLGEYKEGVDFTKAALEIRLELLGEHCAETADSYGNLGNLFEYLHKYNQGFIYQKKALDIRLELFGEKHPDTALSYDSIGTTYGGLHNYKRLFDNKKKALNIYLELYGEKHPDTARSYNNLGYAYGILRKYKERFENQKKSLDIRLELLGEKHPETAFSFYNISFSYVWLKNYHSATEEAQKAVAIQRELLGVLHPDTLNSVHQLVNIYTRNNKAADALKLIAEFLTLIPKSNIEYKKLEKGKRWILSQMQKPGFRQPSFNPKKKKPKRKH